MEKLISRMCDNLIAKQVISSEDKEIYEYCFCTLFMWLCYFAICFVVMLHFDCFIAPLIFFTSFLALRSLMGGWHAPGMVSCLISGLLLFTLAVSLIIYPDITLQEQLLFSCFSVFFTGGILSIFNVQDHPNRELSVTEKQNAKKKSFYLLFVLTLCMVLFALVKRFDITFSIALACFATTALLLLAKFQTKGWKQHET